MHEINIISIMNVPTIVNFAYPFLNLFTGSWLASRVKRIASLSLICAIITFKLLLIHYRIGIFIIVGWDCYTDPLNYFLDVTARRS